MSAFGNYEIYTMRFDIPAGPASEWKTATVPDGKVLIFGSVLNFANDRNPYNIYGPYLRPGPTPGTFEYWAQTSRYEDLWAEFRIIAADMGC